ncbi:MAG: hypothetical protein K0R18_1477 [Bacillales bacterium]|jgi:hypothetical protein|nr:hypothetical protein [Bacillales bacterium]
MELIIILFNTIPLIMMSFIFFIFFIFLYLILYVYININFRGVLEIIFPENAEYKRPLEPFRFFFISILPTTFWREILNIKYDKNFKNLYGKEFYYPIDEVKLVGLLEKYPYFFKIQYLACFFGIFWLIFLGLAYVSDKFF